MTVIPEGFCEAQVAIENSLNSHVSSISLGFQTAPTIEDFSNTYLVLLAALPNIAQDMCTQYAMTSVRFTFPDGEGGTGSSTLEFDDAIEGAVSGSVMDVRNAYVINKLTGTLGRKGRGRFYLPGVNEDWVGELGDVNPTFRTDINNHCTTFLDALLNPDSPLEAEQPYLLHSDPDLDPSPIVGMGVSRLVGRIRRRGM